MKLNPQKLARIVLRTVENNKDGITALISITSLVATTMCAISGQKLADAEIEERNKDLAVNDEEPLTRREEVEVSVRYHIKTVICFGITVFFIYKGYKSNIDKQTQILELTGSYALLSKNFDDLQKAIDETGHRDEVKERVLQNVYEENKERIMAESEYPREDDLPKIIEEITGQTFSSTIEDAKAGINKINYEMMSSNGYPEQSIDDLLSEFGLRRMGGDLGSRIGWDVNYTGLIEPKFYRPDPCDDDPNKNVWVMGYFNPPKENFGKNYGI